MGSRLGNIVGNGYEREVLRRFAPTMRRELNAAVVEVLHRTTDDGPSRLMELTEAAESDNRISPSDGADLEYTDLAALLDTPGGPRCLAAEISITADQADIARAAKRAATLQAITGQTPLALVICSEMSESNRRLADSRGILVITRPE